MDSDILITPYDDSAHRAEVIALWTDVFGYPAAYNAPGKVIDQKIAHDGLFFVAARGPAVVGTVMAGYDGHRGWIYSLAVRPEYRSGGLGSRLLKTAEQNLAALGCTKVNLQILQDNAAASAFYEANGYAVEARISMGKTLD